MVKIVMINEDHRAKTRRVTNFNICDPPFFLLSILNIDQTMQINQKIT